MLKSSLKLIAGLTCLSIMACSHAGTKTNTVQDTTSQHSAEVDNKLANEADAVNYVEVEFKTGSDRLTDTSKASIERLLANARSRGKLDEIKVLAWADKEYPSAEQKKLSSSQRKLADKRGDAVEDYIDSFKYSVDVDKYNMAYRPGVVARVFNTSDARFKKTLVAAGLPTTADDPKVPSKASRVIVMTLLD